MAEARRVPVRLRPAPLIDPPFTDDPRAPDGLLGTLRPHPTSIQLTLDSSSRPGRDRPGSRRDPSRPGPGSPGRGPTVPAPPGRAQPTATVEASQAAGRFVGTCLEILNGFRPLRQIRPRCAPHQAAQVVEQLTRAAARTIPVQPRSSTRPRLQLRRLRVCEPRTGAVEAAAVLAATGDRSWALAIRLERRQGSWICTALQVI